MGMQTCALPIERLDEPRPVDKGWNASQIFGDMRLPDQTDRHLASVTVANGHAEKRLEQKDAFGMMPKCTMARVGDNLLGLIEPLVKCDIVVRHPTPAAPRAEPNKITMGQK